MSRYRLYPTPEQEKILLQHCSHARYVWNLAVEQHAWWKPGRKPAPGYLEQSRQLTAARAENGWLREGSQNVQQQALRDFDRAVRNFFAGTHRKPSWRKAGRNEGFRVTDTCEARKLNRRWAQVKVPKAGRVRFRLSRPELPVARSYRVTFRSGQWHAAFAVVPGPVPAPGNGEVVGVDRGVTVSAALSTGEMLRCPGLSSREERRLRSAQRKAAKAKRGSNRRRNAKTTAAHLKAREASRRKDWCEKTSTDLARRFDVIRVEDLKIRNMTRSARGTAQAPGVNVAAKAGLNRGILGNGWGALVRRLEDKAPGRIERVPSAYTSQRCSACGHVARESRESQAVFRCTACNFTLNADVNAARNIAAGHAVKARRGDGTGRPVTREPQPALLISASWNPPPSGRGGCQNAAPPL
jgi:transposase